MISGNSLNDRLSETCSIKVFRQISKRKSSFLKMNLKSVAF